MTSAGWARRRKATGGSPWREDPWRLLRGRFFLQAEKMRVEMGTLCCLELVVGRSSSKSVTHDSQSRSTVIDADNFSAASHDWPLWASPTTKLMSLFTAECNAFKGDSDSVVELGHCSPPTSCSFLSAIPRIAILVRDIYHGSGCPKKPRGRHDGGG